MGIFSKFEQRLAGGVSTAFAKAFRAEVQPVELASAMRAAMDERAAHEGRGQRPIVPNVFAIELSGTDYDRLTAHEEPLTDELKASAEEHAETQRYSPAGPFALTFARNEELETGVFRIRPAADERPTRADAGQRHDAEGRPKPRFGQYADREPAIDEPAYDERAHDERAFEEPAYEAPHDDRGQERPWVDDERSGPDDGAAFQLPGKPSGQSAHPAQPAHQQHASGRPHEQRPEQHPHAQRSDRRSDVDPNQPSPAAPKAVRERPWLDVDGERYPLLGAITIIGRDDDADVVLDDSGVSRHHSELRITTDGPHLVITLRDMQSTNGTFVNGNPITRHHLADGDRITVGRTSMIFHAGGRR